MDTNLGCLIKGHKHGAISIKGIGLPNWLSQCVNCHRKIYLTAKDLFDGKATWELIDEQ